ARMRPEQTSDDVLVTFQSPAITAAPSAAKRVAIAEHGLVGLTRNTAWMYAKQGIRCNAICPGGTQIESGFAPRWGTLSAIPTWYVWLPRPAGFNWMGTSFRTRRRRCAP